MTIFIDGGSRSNPGESGCGVYDSETKIGHYFYLGKMTNNEAEYSGLLKALELYGKRDTLHIVSDSNLIVQQVNGVWGVKAPTIIPMFEAAMKRIRLIKSFTIKHTLRAGNKFADQLANMAMDQKKSGEYKFK